MNQLVTYVGQSGDCLRLSRVHSLKLAFARLESLRHHSLTTLLHLVRPTSWKHWPIRLNNVGQSSVSAMKYSGLNHAQSGVTCLVVQVAMLCTKYMAFQKTLISTVKLVRIVTFKTHFNILWSFFKGNFDSMGLLQVLFDNLIWYAIGAKRSPASIPGRLVCCLSFCKISIVAQNCLCILICAIECIAKNNSIAMAMINKSMTRGLKQPA